MPHPLMLGDQLDPALHSLRDLPVNAVVPHRSAAALRR